MTYKVTARTPKGNLSVEVEGESRYRCLDLATHYFRAVFGEDLAENDIWWKEVTDIKYRYNVSLIAEDIMEGTIELTKKEAETVAYATNTNNWQNRDGGGYCGSFWIDVDNPKELKPL